MIDSARRASFRYMDRVWNAGADRSWLAALSGSVGLRLIPLPTPTSRFFPSGVTATAVGYQPVGTNPFTWLLLGTATSMTRRNCYRHWRRTASCRRVQWPLHRRASFGGAGEQRVTMVSVTTPSLQSMTDTQLLEAQATKRRSSWDALQSDWGARQQQYARPDEDLRINGQDRSTCPVRNIEERAFSASATS